MLMTITVLISITGHVFIAEELPSLTADSLRLQQEPQRVIAPHLMG